MISTSTGCTKWKTTATKNILFFIAGLFIEFWLRSAPFVGNPISESIVFKNEPTHFTLLEKSQATLALFDGFQDLHLDC